ncbi:DUF1080 domain-containing protein [Streptomyces sp. NEAU-W12]|uniref:3-keto-disaccharide hydrolase n=1 Tax=Streptomyces sp. NEAU-W12 TaxID=2994668 RepID=UPI002B05CF1C|nr:DUF1080 domain-containing protein [Streptomyces sp. NEAU-W12]
MHRSRLVPAPTRRPGLRTALALSTGLMPAAGTPAAVAGAHTGHPGHDEPAAAGGRFQQVPLARGRHDTGEPMPLAVLPDRSAPHTARDGTLRPTVQGGVTKAAGRTPVCSFKSANPEARGQVPRPPGQWDPHEIKVQGGRLRVFLNGVEINDFTGKDPGRSPTDGPIGLQHHGADDQVTFRDIQLKEPPS